MAAAMNVYLTLDYELFLGEKTGTPENCLIRPMDELCKVADKHNFKFVIFVDATYLLRMQQLKGRFKEVDRQYDLVSNHVKSLAEQGHDIELHFHPQWLYSDWDESTQQWEMDRDHYKLSDMPLEDAKRYLKEAKVLLDSIVEYKTIAYRAGGFCLNEFEDFKEIFKELGLKYDSSVARYGHIATKVHYYDYRRIPKKQIYKFSNSIKKEDENGDFVEVSISGIHWHVIKYIFQIRKKRLQKRPTIVYKDGSGIVDKKTSGFTKVIEIIKRNTYLASIDDLWSNLLNNYYEYAQTKKWQELIMIGHPKNASDLSISNLDRFITEHNNINIMTIK